MTKTKPSFFYLLSQRLRGKNFLYEFYFKGKKTVDVGCGEGEFMKFDKSLIYGVDPNQRVIDRLSKEGFHAAVAVGGTMPFADGSFEMAHCHNVIEHLTVEQAYGMIKETARVLQKGGLLVLSSEVVNRKFWETFGHVKPYPPKAVIKLLPPNSREEFEGISNLEFVDVFYLGDYYKNKALYLISAFLGFYTKILRREYFLILRKK